MSQWVFLKDTCPEAVTKWGAELTICLFPDRLGHQFAAQHKNPALTDWCPCASSSLTEYRGSGDCRMCLPAGGEARNFRILDHSSMKDSR